MQSHYDVFLRGIAIDLVCVDERLITESDWYTWFNDEDITATMQQHYFPNTHALQLERYRSAPLGSSDIQLGIVVKEQNLLVGSIGLHDIDWINRHARIAIVIGTTAFHNMKIAVEANRLLLRHAFQALNLHRIHGASFSQGVAELYTRLLGFHHEGVRRAEVYKNGTYHDVYLFGILHDEYDASLKNGAEERGDHSTSS